MLDGLMTGKIFDFDRKLYGESCCVGAGFEADSLADLLRGRVRLLTSSSPRPPLENPSASFRR